MKIELMVILLLAALSLFSCRQEGEKPQEQQVQQVGHTQPQPQAPVVADIHTAIVQEVLQTTSYTYLHLEENGREFWIAVSKREMKQGDTITFAGGLEMKDFESKELQRTFETIYLVSRIAPGEQTPPAAHGLADFSHRMKPTAEKQEISIEPVEGGITIGQLLADPDSYAGKTVLIKGQVTKVNRGIMGKNWVHLQDGTSNSGKFDLTITTQEQVKVGDVVVFEGTIVLNKDFGAGYVYQVIMEEAALKSK